jgi:hypothetical protein
LAKNLVTCFQTSKGQPLVTKCRCCEQKCYLEAEAESVVASGVPEAGEPTEDLPHVHGAVTVVVEQVEHARCQRDQRIHLHRLQDLLKLLQLGVLPVCASASGGFAPFFSTVNKTHQVSYKKVSELCKFLFYQGLELLKFSRQEKKKNATSVFLKHDTPNVTHHDSRILHLSIIAGHFLVPSMDYFIAK